MKRVRVTVELDIPQDWDREKVLAFLSRSIISSAQEKASVLLTEIKEPDFNPDNIPKVLA